MKILHLSDTHGLHEHLVGDWLNEMIAEHEPEVLVHSGDFMRHSMRYQDLADFFDWFKKFEVPHKIAAPGNHDMWCEQLERNDYLKRAVVSNNLHLLINEELVIDGVKFWGSPYTPAFRDWGFQLFKDDGEKLWSTIPDDVDVLITHGPAYEILDVPGEPYRMDGPQGCKHLAKRLPELKHLKAHLFGHIHGSYDSVQIDGSIRSNASILDEAYKVVNKPRLIEV